MPVIINLGPPECPLCLKPMREVITKNGRFFACTEELCMISISANDPVCGKWREKLAAFSDVVCPKDGVQMRIFFRSDRFMKAQCPKCRAEGKRTQVLRGRVEDHDPNTPWNFDPEVDGG